MSTTETQEIPNELLKLVHRPKTDAKGRVVTETKRGESEPVPVMRSISAGEVFAWKDYGDRVVVVTVDGQKYSAAKK